MEEDKVEDDNLEKQGGDVDDDDVEEDDVEEEDRSQDLGPHLVRTCAVEMNLNTSQEPLYTEIYR